MRDTILCLCDLTGVMARPWVEHGYQAKICEDGNFRNFLYAMSLKRLKRKCEKYAKRERKAIEYVTTLKEES